MTKKTTMSNDELDEASFVEHLEDLRKHIIRGLIALILLSVVAFFYNDILFDKILLGPKNPDFITNRILCKLSEWLSSDMLCINQTELRLQNLELAGQFKAHLFVSFLAGVVVGFPYLMWELWMFVKPALTKEEIRKTRGVVFYTSALFFMGVAFGFFLISPLTINFLANYVATDELVNNFTLQSITTNVTSLTLATGAVFELPVLIYFLTKLGLISPRLMKKYRKHSIVAILILGGIITPPDLMSQLLIAIPLYFLYEFSVGISNRVYKQRQKEIYGS